MKLSCNQENLSKGLSVVSKIIGIRSNLPVLNNILLASDKGRLKLSSTDLEIGISTWTGAKVTQDGAITIPAKLLIDFVNTNRDEKIDLELKNDTLHFISNHYQANIKGIPSSEFPLIPKVDENLIAEIGALELQKIISKVIFAAATDETRPVLTGILMNFSSDILKMAATDSYRLAEGTLKLEKKQKEDKQFIVPVRTMSELSRIISILNPVKVKIFLSENQVSFELGDTQIVSRLIEGNYPDYRQIIPEKNTTYLTIDIKAFTNALRVASIFARESANNIKLIVDEDKKAKITAISPQVGDAESILNLIEKKGEKLEIAFNAKFILDTINIITDKNLILEANGKEKPAVLRPEKEKGFTYIVMPLRVDD